MIGSVAVSTDGRLKLIILRPLGTFFIDRRKTEGPDSERWHIHADIDLYQQVRRDVGERIDGEKVDEFRCYGVDGVETVTQVREGALVL